MTLHDVRPAPCFEPRSAGNLTGITTSGGTLRVGRACRSQTLYQFESVLKIKVVLKNYYGLIFDCTFGSRNFQGSKLSPVLIVWVVKIYLPHSISTPLHLQNKHFLNILNQPPLQVSHAPLQSDIDHNYLHITRWKGHWQIMRHFPMSNTQQICT